VDNAELINQTSGNSEYYTPMNIIDAAREAMGSIDLDPASSLEANDRIRADKIFTPKDNGLSQSWFGNVWLNHPFSRADNPLWIDKLIKEFYSPMVSRCCCITYAATSEAWFRPLMDFPQCFLQPRTNYILPDGSIKKGVTKGSVVTYLGADTKRFIRAFDGNSGKVKI